MAQRHKRPNFCRGLRTIHAKSRFVHLMTRMHGVSTLVLHFSPRASNSIITEVVPSQSQQQLKLSGTKVNVMNADSADAFIVFAKRNIGDIVETQCFIIDKANLGTGTIGIQVCLESRMRSFSHHHSRIFRSGSSFKVFAY